MRSRRIRHVAVLVESSRAYGRGLIEGIARFSREHGSWELYFEPRGLEAPPLWLNTWKGDGILARFPSRQAAQSLPALGVPVVHLSVSPTPPGLPLVAADNAAVARMAFDHFWERGLRQFAFCSMRGGDWPYIDQRAEAFRRCARAAQAPCSMFFLTSEHWAVADWEREEEELVAWLLTLPTPVGVMACFDERAFQVLSACRRAGLRVPQDVAVMGAGNDSVLCEMSTPPLSSIDLNAPQIGYAAAACLDRMMRGKAPPRKSIGIQPQKLVVRRSTDMFAADDPDLVAALQFIRDRACDGVQVGDVLRHVAVSQSVLERKFRSFLGRTPKAEMLRVRIARARELLAESDLPLKETARQCGFSSEKYFSDAFHHHCGTRPAAYRRERRQTNPVPGPTAAGSK